MSKYKRLEKLYAKMSPEEAAEFIKLLDDCFDHYRKGCHRSMAIASVIGALACVTGITWVAIGDILADRKRAKKLAKKQ